MILTRTVHLPSGPKIALTGVSYCQDSLRRVVDAARIGPGDRALNLQGVFMPEPSNTADPNAVSIRVDGEHVGYLSRDNAAAYQQVSARIRQVQAEAKVVVALRGNNLSVPGSYVVAFVEVGAPASCLEAVG